MGFSGWVAAADPTKDLGQVKRFAVGVGEAVECGLAELLPVVEAACRGEVVEGSGGGDEGVAEGVVVEDTVEIGGEDAVVRGDAAVRGAVG
jgi:hypothetical protein